MSWGGLYGDLPPPSTSGSSEDAASTTPKEAAAVPPTPAVAGGWSTSSKFLIPVRKKPTVVPAPAHGVSKVALLSKPAIITPKEEEKEPEHVNEPPAPEEAPAAEYMDEYDPARPNDYMQYRQERNRKKREAQLLAERERELREREREREKEKTARGPSPPPQERKVELNISGEEAFLRRARLSGRALPPSLPDSNERDRDPDRDGDSGPPPPEETSPAPKPSGIGKGMSDFAARMMSKMGWREGQGLGKHEQGIAVPLQTKKTARTQGVIINESAKPSPPPPPPPGPLAPPAPGLPAEKKAKGASLRGVPTKVLLLKNMVGPGEVDDDLEAETAEECTKYGQVERCVIFEVTDGSVSHTEAVRIFVAFVRQESAVKAAIDLDGRFFGGRVVSASFFDEARFERHDVAPGPGE